MIDIANSFQPDVVFVQSDSMSKYINGGLIADNTERVVILDAGAQYGKVSLHVFFLTAKLILGVYGLASFNGMHTDKSVNPCNS